MGLSASVEDLAKRRISNWIPVAAALAGFAIHIHGNGWKGALSAALGLVAGFCVIAIVLWRAESGRRQKLEKELEAHKIAAQTMEEVRAAMKI